MVFFLGGGGDFVSSPLATCFVRSVNMLEALLLVPNKVEVEAFMITTTPSSPL